MRGAPLHEVYHTGAENMLMYPQMDLHSDQPLGEHELQAGRLYEAKGLEEGEEELSEFKYL